MYPTRKDRNTFFIGSGIKENLFNILEEKSTNVLSNILNTGEKTIETKLNNIVNKKVGSGKEVNAKLKSILDKKNTLYGKGLKTYKE